MFVWWWWVGDCTALAAAACGFRMGDCRCGAAVCQCIPGAAVLSSPPAEAPLRCLPALPPPKVLEEQLGRRGDAVAPLEPMLQRTLADIQERLTFRAQVGGGSRRVGLLGECGRAAGRCKLPAAMGCRCQRCILAGCLRSTARALLGPPLPQAFVREQIAGFVPKPEDLDYPERLQRRAQQPQQALQQQAQQPGGSEGAKAADGAAAGGAAEGAAEGEPAAVVVANGGDAAEAPGELYASWYPPVQRTLLLLGKLYRGVDQRIFNGLAHEAVLAATAAVQGAAAQLLKVGSEGRGACHRCSLRCAAARAAGRAAHALFISSHPRHSPHRARSPRAPWTASCLPSSSCWCCASRLRPLRPTSRSWSETWVRAGTGRDGPGRWVGVKRTSHCSSRPAATQRAHPPFASPTPCPCPPRPTRLAADFSHMRDYLRRTLSGQLPLFSLSSDSVVVQLLGRAAPRIAESSVDSKKVCWSAGREAGWPAGAAPDALTAGT